MPIYTKTGDKGETGVIGGRLPKSSPTINAIGELDELNASLGLVISTIKLSSFRRRSGRRSRWLSSRQMKSNLQSIQSIIFSIGSLLAGAKIEVKLEEETKNLEKQIDEFEKELPPLQNFILPGGTQAAAQIHLARTICRRAERAVVQIKDEGLKMKDKGKIADYRLQTSEKLPEILKYINRLSDYLFVLARYVNHKEGGEEVKWGTK